METERTDGETGRWSADRYSGLGRDVQKEGEKNPLYNNNISRRPIKGSRQIYMYITCACVRVRTERVAHIINLLRIALDSS